tara:strand:+ start:278 stop:532 length:255 start_codon:yes stop_codon:yes gene_type:complete
MPESEKDLGGVSVVFAAWGSGGGVAEVRSGSLDVRGGFGGRNMVFHFFQLFIAKSSKILKYISLSLISCLSEVHASPNHAYSHL